MKKSTIFHFLCSRQIEISERWSRIQCNIVLGESDVIIAVFSYLLVKHELFRIGTRDMFVSGVITCTYIHVFFLTILIDNF